LATLRIYLAYCSLRDLVVISCQFKDKIAIQWQGIICLTDSCSFAPGTKIAGARRLVSPSLAEAGDVAAEAPAAVAQAAASAAQDWFAGKPAVENVSAVLRPPRPRLAVAAAKTWVLEAVRRLSPPRAAETPEVNLAESLQRDLQQVVEKGAVQGWLLELAIPAFAHGCLEHPRYAIVAVGVVAFAVLDVLDAEYGKLALLAVRAVVVDTLLVEWMVGKQSGCVRHGFVLLAAAARVLDKALVVWTSATSVMTAAAAACAASG